MKGKIVNYRRGGHTEYTNQYIIEVEGVNSKEEAEKLRGKKVAWTTTSGKRIAGSVSHAHGNKGAVLARFNQGLPGQAIGTEVEVG